MRRMMMTSSLWISFFSICFISGVANGYIDYSHLVVDMNTINLTEDNPSTKAAEPFSLSICPTSCVCDRRPLMTCRKGIQQVMDGCNCCPICPRQLGQTCNRRYVCDSSKNLQCDLTSLTCQPAVRIYRSCFIMGMMRPHGYSYKKSCDMQCECQDGAISCKDLCFEAKQPPRHRTCQMGFYKQIGKCCGKWMCDDMVPHDKRRPFYRHDIQAIHPEHEPAQVVPGFGCLAQVTPWSPCSKTCGTGISTRINSQNKRCKLIKESRVCVNRPCSSKPKKHTKKRTLPSCMKTWRPRRQKHLEVDGCSSVSAYRPRYCRSCPGYCCRPTVTKTIRVEFQCPAEESRPNFFKRYMWTKKCSCFPGDCHDRTERAGVFMGDLHTHA